MSIAYPDLCIDPGATLLIGDFPSLLVGSDGADALLRQFGSLPNGSVLTFSHSFLSSADEALVFDAWRDSYQGNRPLTLPARLAGGVDNATMAARILTPQGQRWFFDGSPNSRSDKLGRQFVGVALRSRSAGCGAFF